MKKFYTFKRNACHKFDVGYYDDLNRWFSVLHTDTPEEANLHTAKLNMSERNLEKALKESLNTELDRYADRLEKMVRALVSNGNFTSNLNISSTVETADYLIREIDEFYSQVEAKSKENFKSKT